MIACDDPHHLQSYAFPERWPLLVLAPHPDDFDAIGVTMRYFQENGNSLYVVVATYGASGVEDGFCPAPTVAAKARLREEEQRASCRFFGLAEDHLVFLGLEEDEAGHPVDNVANFARLRQHILIRQPALVFLPHGHDTNPGHQRIYAMYRQVACEAGYPSAAFLNRDPKTVRMRCDVVLGYGPEEAAWKGELLRFHRSQQQRNLNQRGHGFDERILSMDRQSAQECSLELTYAEAFEVEFFGANGFSQIPGWCEGE
jgi:LmbE family N-acetylglucosaminyl deacetylase